MCPLHLQWAKGDEGWGFYHEDIDDDGQHIFVRLTKASRPARVFAYARLPEFLAEIEEALVRESEEITKVTTDIPKWILEEE